MSRRVYWMRSRDPREPDVEPPWVEYAYDDESPEFIATQAEIEARKAGFIEGLVNSIHAKP